MFVFFRYFTQSEYEGSIKEFTKIQPLIIFLILKTPYTVLQTNAYASNFFTFVTLQQHAIQCSLMGFDVMEKHKLLQNCNCALVLKSVLAIILRLLLIVWWWFSQHYSATTNIAIYGDVCAQVVYFLLMSSKVMDTFPRHGIWYVMQGIEHSALYWLASKVQYNNLHYLFWKSFVSLRYHKSMHSVIKPTF